MKRRGDVDAPAMTDRDIADRRDAGALAVVPVGAIEQHGPHLPIDTDTASAHGVALAAARRVTRHPVLVFAPLAHGFSPHHLSRPGTISLSLEAFLRQVREVATCLARSGFPRIAFVNGHGGNSAPLRAIVSEMVTEGLPVTAVDYWAPSRAAWSQLLRGQLKDVGHACEFETALQMATRPADVAERIGARARGLPPRLTQPYVAAGASDRFAPAGAVAPPIFLSDDCGYYGDPAAATAEVGEALLQATADGLAEFLAWFADAPLVTGRS